MLFKKIFKINDRVEKKQAEYESTIVPTLYHGDIGFIEREGKQKWFFTLIGDDFKNWDIVLFNRSLEKFIELYETKLSSQVLVEYKEFKKKSKCLYDLNTFKARIEIDPYPLLILTAHQEFRAGKGNLILEDINNAFVAMEAAVYEIYDQLYGTITVKPETKEIDEYDLFLKSMHKHRQEVD